MRPPRVSLRGSMLIVTGVSLGLAALRFSTPNVAGAVIVTTLFGLSLAILAAMYRRESSRAFWVGFALMGWGYLGFSFGSWTLSEQEANSFAKRGLTGGTGFRGPPPLARRDHWLGTTTLLDDIRLSVQASNHGAGVPTSQVASFFGFRDARLQTFHAALNFPVAMPFAQETPLDEVLKYIKKSTTSKEFPEGIPIYVDPVGLQEAEKTMASPITLELQGVPLWKSLKLFLGQLDLVYSVSDGLMTITCLSSIANQTAGVESFRRVGHSVFALIFAVIGGFAARNLYATCEPRSVQSP
jgi:hypothetical protein